MVYKFFDKKTEISGVNTTLATQNQQLAEELHKPIAKKFKNRKIHAAFKDNIWDADLAEMQLLSRYNKGIIFLLWTMDHLLNINKEFKSSKKLVIQTRSTKMN